jgi:hypothetical protein
MTGTAILRRLAGGALLAGVLALGGCGSLLRNGVPGDMMATATIPGMPDVRAPAGRANAIMARDMAKSFTQESPKDFPAGSDGVIVYPQLALSGGGANGAFGAGFLNGWTSMGTRPVFKVVTGVSTGALMAPFAFLGSAKDDALRDFYTNTSTRDIFVLGTITGIVRQLLFSDGIADTAPLAALIATHIDDAFVRDIAAAHLGGRRLYIGTTDLDSQRFMIWNMGLIATSGHPDAVTLFRRVMLASASIPVAFAPVLFEVEASNGRRYDELHVDGGVGANVFYNGNLFSARRLLQEAGRSSARQDVYVIHNGQLAESPGLTRRTIPSVALRTLEAATHSGMINDLFRIFAVTTFERSGFFWTTIPNGVEMRGDETFDPVLMRQLYDLGFEAARAGPAWRTRPPSVLDMDAGFQ